MGVAAAALHEGMRVPMSGQSIQSKYFCYLMENMYTKVNNVSMYECMYAYRHVYMHIQRVFSLLFKKV